MSWARIKEIEVDHRIPLEFGNPLFEEKIARFHYLNCQPMWALENAAKGSRFIGRSGEEIYELPTPLTFEPHKITDDDLAELLGFTL